MADAEVLKDIVPWWVAAQLAIATLPMQRTVEPKPEPKPEKKPKGAKNETPPPQQPIIPAKAVTLLTNLVPDGSMVMVQLRRNDAVFTFNGGRLHTRLVEGRFPKYRDVVPQTCSHWITFSAGAVSEAVRNAMVQTTDESRGIDFTFWNDMLRLEAVGVGSGTVETDVRYGGPSLTVTLDPKFVLDFLASLDKEAEVRLGINAVNTATVFNSGTSQCVIMPLAREDKVVPPKPKPAEHAQDNAPPVETPVPAPVPEPKNEQIPNDSTVRATLPAPQESSEQPEPMASTGTRFGYSTVCCNGPEMDPELAMILRLAGA